jgi:AmmeMemoRadiSam system protein A
MPKSLQETTNRPDGARPLAEAQRATLIEVAHRAIAARLDGDPAGVRATDFPDPLRAPRATFVTLRISGELRGCVGSFEAERTLVESVWHNAQQAAFADPRFPPLTASELGEIEIHVSILGPREAMTVGSEQDLLDQLRPGVDGLVIEDGPHRATFLPAVWESLSDPADFVRELKRKAGLPADHWSSRLSAWRYSTESFP